MLDFIKEMRRKRIIKELMEVPREKKIDNIDEIKTIGVICILDSEQNWNILQHFAKVMENMGKRVHFIALLPKDKEMNFVITHRDTYICRMKSDFNFWGLPEANIIRPFTSRHYDLLIDTIGADDFFVKYVILNTPADLRAGYATTNDEASDVFDFIIRGEGVVDLKYLFNNVIEYLGMIKK